MKSRLTFTRPILVALVLGACALTAACATPPDEITIDVSDKIRADGPIIAKVHATGFQVYICKADAVSGQLAWTLKAPDATFEGANGLKGKHYAGPTWESTVDGSKVVGKKLAEEVHADAIPWLLLAAADHTGNGLLSTVTYIQRINTTGGKAPPIGNAQAGDELPVAYTADYIFRGPGTTTQPAKP